jgi:hypothetical protein
LKLACATLLLALSIGCFLLRANLDQKLEASIRNFRFSYDLAGIEQMIASGKITRGSAEHDGLFIAAWMTGMENPFSEPMPWTEEARTLGEKTKPLLPSAKFLKEPKRGVFGVWAERNIMKVEKCFYAVSVASLVLLLVSIIVR